MKNFNKGFSFLFFLIIIALITSVGFVVYNKVKGSPATVTKIPVFYTYNNDTYGFKLIFPEEWKNYRVAESPSSIWFGINDQDKIIGIDIHKITQAEKLAEVTEPPSTDLLGENSTYTFSLLYPQGYTDSVATLAQQKDSIISSFKLAQVATGTQPTITPNN